MDSTNGRFHIRNCDDRLRGICDIYAVDDACDLRPCLHGGRCTAEVFGLDLDALLLTLHLIAKNMTKVLV